jgi:hypothetical protein
MNEILNITGRPPLPMPHCDRTCRHLILRQALAVDTTPDDLFMLLEARRILMPEGGLSLIVDAARDEAPIQHCADLLGLKPSSRPILSAPIGLSAGEKILN